MLCVSARVRGILSTLGLTALVTHPQRNRYAVETGEKSNGLDYVDLRTYSYSSDPGPLPTATLNFSGLAITAGVIHVPAKRTVKFQVRSSRRQRPISACTCLCVYMRACANAQVAACLPAGLLPAPPPVNLGVPSHGSWHARAWTAHAAQRAGRP